MKIMPKDDYMIALGYHQFSDDNYLRENYLSNIRIVQLYAIIRLPN